MALNLVVMSLRSSTSTAEEPTAPELLPDFPLPGSINVCGESIPLENRRVLEMLDREFTIAVWDRAQVFLWLKRTGRYFPYIEEKLAEAGMPDELKYMAVAESALITDIKSRKRAVGLWQFMSRTGRRYGLRKNRSLDERLDFEQSTEAAIKYLQRLHDKFDNWTLALAAYN
ncbi:MAG: lytic transglycosylase domain-containing protein, partial [Deltaproteobacteria bacterium]|nr:lytic transglycosylase domain-containing protein [Deltaproteobacteria bacterium]